MTRWTSDELTQIAAADELEIASLGRVGTLRDPTTIWVVRLGDDLYVRWHWHGAAPDYFMTLLSMHVGDVEWGEHVVNGESHGRGST